MYLKLDEDTKRDKKVYASDLKPFILMTPFDYLLRFSQYAIEVFYGREKNIGSLTGNCYRSQELLATLPKLF